MVFRVMKATRTLRLRLLGWRGRLGEEKDATAVALLVGQLHGLEVLRVRVGFYVSGPGHESVTVKQ